MIKRELTETELLTLQEAQKNSEKPHFRNRSLAILLLNKNKSVSYVSDLLDVRKETVYNWASKWTSEGLSGLMIAKGRGVKAKLDIFISPVMEESLGIIKKNSGESSEIGRSFR